MSSLNPRLSTWHARLPSPNPAVAWQRLARCNTYDTDIFFPPENENVTARIRRESMAKRICSGCPVMMRCRAEAVLTQQDHGVWGGLSETDRLEFKDPHRFDTIASGEFSR